MGVCCDLKIFTCILVLVGLLMPNIICELGAICGTEAYFRSLQFKDFKYNH